MDQKDLFSKKLQHYDYTYEYSLNHDPIPYKRNEDMCNAGTIAMYSGNVLKSPVYNLNQQKPFVYKAPDMSFETEETEATDSTNDVALLPDNEVDNGHDENSSSPKASGGISADQLDSLLADNGNEGYTPTSFDNKV